MAHRDRSGRGGWLIPVALACVFVLAACLALREVASSDVGFHLAAGEWILDGNGWPRTDPFTFTVGEREYLDTSWGFQVLAAVCERSLGAPGLVALRVTLVLVLLTLLHATIRLGPADSAWTAILLLLGVLAMEMRYVVRPELLSYVLLAGLLFVAHRHAERGTAPLWTLPVVFLVWVNCHSLFVLGWGVLGCFALGLRLRDGRWDRRLLVWSAAAVAVTLVNPYGWRAIVFPLTLLSRFGESNVFNQSIGDFRSPFGLGLSAAYPFYPRLPIWAFRGFCVLAVLALLPVSRARRFWCVLLAIPFGYLAVRMVRNMPLLVIVALPWSVWGLSAVRLGSRLRLGAGTSAWLRHALVAATVAVALLSSLRVYHDAYYIASRRQDRFGVGWNALTQPIGAVRYAERAGLTGRVLNHLNFGGYLIWARREPVFIDGRLEVMGEAFFDEYRAALRSEVELERTVARHDIEWMVFPYRLMGPLLRAVSRDSRWTLAYVDHLAVVFVRADRLPTARVEIGNAFAGPATPPSIRELPGLGGPPRRDGVARWVDGLLRRQRFPVEPFYSGLFHYFRGDHPRAAGRFARSIAESDGAYYEMYQNLGSALYRMGRLADARACYRVVLESDPRSRVATERIVEIDRRSRGRPGSGGRGHGRGAPPDGR